MKLSLFALIFALLPVIDARAEDPAPAAQKPVEHLVKWQDSEAGQFVFFAVLEGLYRDGVSKEVVDLVINPAKDIDNKVKHVFVFECDICHAAYEAFVLYGKRQTFQLSAGRDTFGKGVAPQLVKALSSDEAPIRVRALGQLIRPWIAYRVELAKLSREKQEELVKTLLKFKKEAGGKLSDLRRADPLYKDWRFYGGCQACEAAGDIAEKWGK